MAKQSSNDDHFDGPIDLTIELFKKMECTSGCLPEIGTKRQKEAIKMLDAEKMRCHILDCLVALRRLQREERLLKIINGNGQYECAKKRIFASAVSMILDEEGSIESDQNVLSLLLKPFPDTVKMTDGRSWLPMHFALALGNKVREEDIHEMHSVEPLLIQRYNLVKPQQVRYNITKYTPCYFLCMQRNPNLSLIRYLSMRDLKAFTICSHEESWYSSDIRYTNALQLATKHSENVELLKILIQIDQSMTKMSSSSTFGRISALGILCKRSSSQFSTFNSMLECLIIANSSADVVTDGLQSCFKSFKSSSIKDINALLAIMQLFLEGNGIEGYGTSTFQVACTYLKGEMCIEVLRLLLTNCNEGAGLRVMDDEGDLPIHIAARFSTLDVFEYLLQAYPGTCPR
jgi:ankyrin repeat protein